MRLGLRGSRCRVGSRVVWHWSELLLFVVFEGASG